MAVGTGSVLRLCLSTAAFRSDCVIIEPMRLSAQESLCAGTRWVLFCFAKMPWQGGSYSFARVDYHNKSKRRKKQHKGRKILYTGK